MNNLKPFISILMPVYNTKKEWLIEAIESVINQEFKEWELCIVDDCSSNEYIKDLLNLYQSKYPNIIVKYLKKNVGIAGATNEAFQLCKGKYVSLLDHDDVLDKTCLNEVVKYINQNPNVDLIYTDEDKISLENQYVEPYFKPDFSPDTLMTMNYINHFTVIRTELVKRVGGWVSKYDGSQDYDLLLKITEQTKNIGHIRKVLYHWRKSPNSTASFFQNKSYALENGRKALDSSLIRRNISGSVQTVENFRYKVNYDVIDNPLVSIIIPTKDQLSLLEKCITSILEKTIYNEFEIIIVNNNSIENKTLNYFKEIQSVYDFIKVIDCPIPFNYSILNNVAVEHASGSYLLFLNNDTEVVVNEWLEEMLGLAQLNHVGGVGAKLIYPNNSIQHVGVSVGKGIAWHLYQGYPANIPYDDNLNLVKNVIAVTGACLMVSKSKFIEVGMFDEELDVVYNDVDLCLKLWKKGYYNVINPNSILIHYESMTRDKSVPKNNLDYFTKKWKELIENGDPFDTTAKVYNEKVKYYLKTNSVQENNRELFIWGAGSSGVRMYLTLKNINITPNGFIDSDPKKSLNRLFDLSINVPKTIFERKKKPYVIIASMYVNEIKKELEDNGYKYGEDFWCDYP